MSAVAGPQASAAPLLKAHEGASSVDANHGDVVYGLSPCDGRDGGSLTIRHAGVDLDLSTDAPTTVRLTARTPSLPEPRQPVGCRPQRRQR
jgi:hypothetical protein